METHNISQSQSQDLIANQVVFSFVDKNVRKKIYFYKHT